MGTAHYQSLCIINVSSIAGFSIQNNWILSQRDWPVAPSCATLPFWLFFKQRVRDSPPFYR